MTFVRLLIVCLAFPGAAALAQEKTETAPKTTPPAEAAKDAPTNDAAKTPPAREDAKAPDADAKGEAKPVTPTTPAEPAATADQFPQLKKEWEELETKLNDLANQFLASPSSEEKSVIRARYVKLVEQSEKLLPKLRAAGEAAFAAAPGTDKGVTEYMIKFVAYEYRQNDFAAAHKLASQLIDAQVDDPNLFALAGAAAIEIGDYENGEKWRAIAKEAKKFDAATDARLETRLAEWAKEQEILKKEAEADDLPRVKLETSKGTIVVELFENEAPQTVANFISLVEKGFYNGLAFHRVIPGFMAQGGDPKGDGTGGPDYKIYDETNRPDYRRHFRGSLSMAKSFDANSGGSQFFIAYHTTSRLDGKHTVFGRVLEGMDVVDKLQPRTPEDAKPGATLPEPDKIVKAEVVRKREHEYVPTKVEIKVPPVGKGTLPAKTGQK